MNKKSELDRSEQEKIFGKKVLISDISNFYEKLTCSNCKKKYPQIIDKNEKLSLIPLLRTGVSINCLISKPRRKFFQVKFFLVEINAQKIFRA